MAGKLSLATLIVLLWVWCSYATQKPTYYLNPDKNFTQYSYHHWTSENGLSTNSLLNLLQTSDGYLWMSSYSGLIRFDGLNFKLYNSSNTPQFKSNVIRNLVEDKSGVLWLSTQGNGLVAYENGSFKVYGKEQNLMYLYRGLLADDKNRIWSASPDRGWFYFENGIFHIINHTTSLQNIEVRTIVQGNSGEIWFATLGKGLFKYENDQLVSYTVSDGLIDNWVYSLFVDTNNTLWIGTSTGICYFDGNQFVKILPEINFTVNKILRDRNGKLWIGTNDGLFRYDLGSKKLECFSKDNGLSNNYIVDFLFDKEGNFWMTHYKSGLSRISDGKFTNFTKLGGLPGNVVNAVCEFKKQRFVVGFDNGELAEISNNKILPFKLKTNLNNTRIRHIMSDSKGNLWISSYLGLLQKKPDGSEIWADKLHGLNGLKIRLTFEDSNGNLWIGTRNSGLIKMENNGKISFFNVDNGLTSNLIMSIAEDTQGTIWVGTSEGKGSLNSISKNGLIKLYNQNTGFNSDIVFNLYCDNNGTLWIATTTGLWVYYYSKFFNITVGNGLLASSIFDVVEDDFGSLWMPFDEGIMRVNKQEIISFIQSDKEQITCKVYNKSDGLSTNECNPTSQVLKSQGGLLLFPTLDGISIIDPIDELVNNYIPTVVIEEIKADDQVVDLKKPLIFKRGLKRFTFSYTAISLYNSDKIKFKYQLLGFEDKWIETDNLRTVSFTNLAHGNYTFKVTSTNSDGIWNDNASQISFTIKPRFVETTLFNILILILTITMGYGFYFLRISKLKRTKNNLEININERTREILKKNQELELQKKEIQEKNNVLNIQKSEIELQALKLERQKEELNDSNKTKDKIFSIISHDLRGPIGNIKNMLDLMILKQNEFDDAKKNRIIENLSEITKSTFYLTDNLLNWSKSQRGMATYNPRMFLVTPVIKEILELTKPTATKKNINLISNIESSELAYADLNMVKTIFRNLIDNALKFTNENGTIELSSTKKGVMVEYAIKDSGVGIKPDDIEKIVNSSDIKTTFGTFQEKGSGLGLLICKEFIKECEGDLRIESTPGVGSIFFFTLKRFQV